MIVFDITQTVGIFLLKCYAVSAPIVIIIGAIKSNRKTKSSINN